SSAVLVPDRQGTPHLPLSVRLLDRFLSALDPGDAAAIASDHGCAGARAVRRALRSGPWRGVVRAVAGPSQARVGRRHGRGSRPAGRRILPAPQSGLRARRRNGLPDRAGGAQSASARPPRLRAGPARRSAAHMTGWAAILAAAESEHTAFCTACRAPRAAQLGLLRRILRDNAPCEFGRAHGFDRIAGLEDFRARLPIRTYDELRPWIDRMAQGASAVLVSAPVVAFEETGGSTAGAKLIPYTESALAAFRAAVLPWLADLSRRRPAAFAGRAFIAVSPATRPARVTAGAGPARPPARGA